MFTDHWYHIIGGPEILNIIGRTAFPIFAFSLSEGYAHTRNLKKYLIRLFLFATVMQIPEMIFNLNYPMNIFFTLFTGLLIISIYHSDKINIFIKTVFITVLCYIAHRLEFDYGIYGVLTIMIFHFFRNDKIKIAMSFLLLNLINYTDIFNMAHNQIYSVFALIPIFLYNGRKGRNMKYLFYLFYPLHFIILEMIKYTIERYF